MVAIAAGMNVTPKLGSLMCLALLVGCAQSSDSSGDGPTHVNSPISWEEFRDTAYHEDFEGGVFIVNGDEAIESVKKLHEFYDRMVGEQDQQELIIQKLGSGDDKWSDTQKKNLKYCISNTFGTNKSKVVTAMAQATAAWSAVANVGYVYVSSEDANCVATNNNVVFDIRPVSGQDYLARSFFPDTSRSARNVLIDTSSFSSSAGVTVTGILRHELGHTLGFRHEHTRPEAGTCFEDNNWRALTPYDRSSVMHYPQCNGVDTGLVITAMDASGAASVYGAPQGGTGGSGGTGGAGGAAGSSGSSGSSGSAGSGAGGAGGSAGSSGSSGSSGTSGAGGSSSSGTVHTDEFEGTVAKNATGSVGPFTVVSGSPFKVVMTGTGDADLYVRFGAAPTTTKYTCRPYLDGSDETCDLTVPAGQTTAYVSAIGYATTSDIDLAVTYTTH